MNQQTDLSKKLRALHSECKNIGMEHINPDVLLRAAEEIEQYYTGMLNWKASAESSNLSSVQVDADVQLNADVQVEFEKAMRSRNWDDSDLRPSATYHQTYFWTGTENAFNAFKDGFKAGKHAKNKKIKSPGVDGSFSSIGFNVD